MKRSIPVLSLIAVFFAFPAQAEKMRTLDYNAPKSSAPLYVPKTEQENEPAEKVWERYKALAAGSGQRDQETEPEPKAGPAPQKQGGFAGLLQKHNENKKRRGVMRSITMN